MNTISRKSKHIGSLFVTSLIFLNLLACSDNGTQSEDFNFNGSTMGTTYHITIVGDPIDSQARSRIATQVDSVLQEFNRILSTYEDQSEISRFNRNQTLEPITATEEFLHVVEMGLDLCSRSNGAFDITIMPIINFFGFGFEPGEDRFPTVEEIDSWLQMTGCDKLEILDTTLIKLDARVSIDLSAIAKGDGADHVAKFLGSLGFDNLFVEIGGEITARGVNKSGNPWRIGIDRPTFGGAPGADLQRVIQLTNMSVASSGDYRNYREVEGRRISHMIDPRSGSPINHNLAAVTVLSPQCMLADGLATSVMVMGPEEGLSWLESYPEVEGLLIIREQDGSFIELMTTGFEKYIVD